MREKLGSAARGFDWGTFINRNKKTFIVGLLAFVALLFVKDRTIGYNDEQNWQIKQSLWGDIEVVDRGGYYFHFFNTVWTYPRTIQEFFSASTKEGGLLDESVRVTFNDGGTAQVSTMVRFRLPGEVDKRRLLHKDFANNIEGIVESVRSHLINSCKTAAPLMSASEHQSARKGEYTQLVNQQLRRGLFKMKKIEKVLKDRFDEKGKPITTFATEIITDKDGAPKIEEISPLVEYGITVLQFSVTSTDYDAQTLASFAAKKKQFLAAEESKSSRQAEVQQRLFIVEKGKREKAEVTAKANKEKEQATITAEQQKKVAELQAEKKVAVEKQAKLEAETKARKLYEVAKINKQQADTVAAQKLSVAILEAKAALQQARAIKTLAKAEEERIRLAGAITERDKILATIEANRDVNVATQLSKVKVPQWLIVGGGGQEKGAKSAGLTENLMNLVLLKSAGNLTQLGQPAAKIKK